MIKFDDHIFPLGWNHQLVIDMLESCPAAQWRSTVISGWKYDEHSTAVLVGWPQQGKGSHDNNISHLDPYVWVFP